ncbi:MAG: hypothetical protein NXI31_07450 [bacterium]|nr:hypothetical protein [bacterium]
MIRPLAMTLPVISAILALAALARGQCGPLPAGIGPVFPSFAGVANVHLAPGDELLISGAFTTVDGATVNNIARFDGSTWSGLGGGVTAIGFVPFIADVTELPGGDLVVGGAFTSAGTISTNSVARWNGSSWQALAGGGIPGRVFAMTTLPNGELVAGGTFSSAGGQPANSIARWDGATWQPLGSGITGGAAAVEDLLVLPNGDLIAAGAFTQAGGAGANGIARWDGASWSPLGSGTTGTIDRLLSLPNGDVVVGGDFTIIGGAFARNIARWNGTTWSPVGAGLDGRVNALLELPDGDLLAGGLFQNSGTVSTPYYARFDGTAWSAYLPTATRGVRDFARRQDGAIAVCGGDNANFAAWADWLDQACPATVQVGVAGCSGSMGLYALTAAENPWVGTTFVSRADGFPHNAFGLSVYGLAAQNVQLSTLTPLADPSCTLGVTPDALLLLLSPVAGRVEVPFTIPVDLGLVGVQLHHQVLAAEQGLTAMISRVAATPSLTLTIGAL